MLSYKKKNYALMEEDGSIRIKGSSLTSRSMERFGRDFIRRCIRHLLEGNTEVLHKVFTEMRDRILQHQMEVRDFARVETLSESLTDYRSAVESGGRTRSAAYEVALASEGRFRRGSRVAYYLTGDDPNPKGFRHCRSASDWDPNFPDENVPYYLRRLDELCEKFRPFFSPRDFRAIFSADDLFPFSPEGIRILPPIPPKPESEVEPEGS
jgi:DNA polymerase elongation subunit (family B)